MSLYLCIYNGYENKLNENDVKIQKGHDVYTYYIYTYVMAMV
jgi:hypothetical protein